MCHPGDGHVTVQACSSLTQACDQAISKDIHVSEPQIHGLGVDGIKGLADEVENPLSFFHILMGSSGDLADGDESVSEVIEFAKKKVSVSRMFVSLCSLLLHILEKKSLSF